jgi:hypothetical protein
MIEEEVSQVQRVWRKAVALQLFINDEAGEFQKLYPITGEVITFPEFIQSSLPGQRRGAQAGERQGRQEATEAVPAGVHRISDAVPHGWGYRAAHGIGFQNAAGCQGTEYQWKVNPYDVFKQRAEHLYEVLLSRVRRLRRTRNIGWAVRRS